MLPAAIGLRKQITIQLVLMAVSMAAHAFLVRSGIGKYSLEDPRWYDILNLSLMVSTTTGMSNCVPVNPPAMLVTWTHTVLIFLVLSL